MPYIKKDFIERLIDRVDIVDVIGSRLTLKRSGSSYMCCCPFHNEKTPSFSVNQQKQFYNCFGCHKSGNVLGFIMDYDQLSFPEAVEQLAKEAGVPVEYEESSGKTQEKREYDVDFYELLEQAAGYYEAELSRHPEALAYLHGRGLSDDTLRRYHVGFAPESWDFLIKKLAGDNPKILKAMAELGLATQSQQGKIYDTFRNRVMIPIRDKRGRTIAFGGRVLDDSKPKYINSRESPVYKKGHELFNLDSIRNLRDKNLSYIMITEGYMDVIALEQSGIHNAVASLGTATTPEQMNLLFKQSDRIIFCYDGDSAGRNAAWHALNTALPALRDDKQLQFCFLPPEHDPDTLVRTQGAQAMIDYLEHAESLPEYIVSTLEKEYSVADDGSRVNCIDRASELLSMMPEATLTRTAVEKRLANLVGWSQESLHSSIDTAIDNIRARKAVRGAELRESSRKQGGYADPDAIPMTPMRAVVARLVKDPELLRAIPEPDRMVALLNEYARDRSSVLLDLISKIKASPDTTTGAILEKYRESGNVGKLIGLLAARSDTEVEQEGFVEIKIIDLLHFIKNILMEHLTARTQALRIKGHKNGGLDTKDLMEFQYLETRTRELLADRGREG
ncbi:DNA primase [Succinimonas amylolytica]|uniref:DNA primase n=1 Tax=Succinimonas amylolytica TaxID=83769 RepID=UPI00036E9A37|nr:DNA primase [Succinimonas amylolytica]